MSAGAAPTGMTAASSNNGEAAATTTLLPPSRSRFRRLILPAALVGCLSFNVILTRKSALVPQNYSDYYSFLIPTSVAPLATENDGNGNSNNTATTATARVADKKSVPVMNGDSDGQQLPRPQEQQRQAARVDKTIRKWGCGLNFYPYVFVHIGKAGGGGARARMSASALDFNRTNWRNNKEDTAYYPIQASSVVQDDTTAMVRGNAIENGTTLVVRKARFCNSGGRHFFPEVLVKTFEGSLLCGATTPISKALACPFNSMQCCDDVNGDSSDMINTCGAAVVNVGHTLLGSEMHWLPPKYLTNWWEKTYHRSDGGDNDERSGVSIKILERLKLLDSDEFCNGRRPSHGAFRQYSVSYPTCHRPKEAVADQLSNSYFNDDENRGGNVTDWSFLYASLPVIRTTIVRDPWSWLLSKFFWHGYQRWTSCDDIENATMFSGRVRVPASEIEVYNHPRGWATRSALQYIMYICGEDCRSRMHLGYIKSLDELEIQSEGNLRRSFAVVGLLNETDTFYDMLDARVAYMVRSCMLGSARHLGPYCGLRGTPKLCCLLVLSLLIRSLLLLRIKQNMSLNPHVKGGKHGSGKKPGKEECKQIFAQQEFRDQLIAASPEIAILDRLFHVAEEVNRFQLEDLRRCNPSLDSKLRSVSHKPK